MRPTHQGSSPGCTATPSYTPRAYGCSSGKPRGSLTPLALSFVSRSTQETATSTSLSVNLQSHRACPSYECLTGRFVTHLCIQRRHACSQGVSPLLVPDSTSAALLTSWVASSEPDTTRDRRVIPLSETKALIGSGFALPTGTAFARAGDAVGGCCLIAGACVDQELRSPSCRI
jgi:hypothetical protein